MAVHKNILLFGAGKSTGVLINYLLDKSYKYDWKIIIVDANPKLAISKAKEHPNAIALSFDINNKDERIKLIKNAAIVISMLPPALHYLVALDCIEVKKNLLTASYIDEKTKTLQSAIKNNGLLFLYEMGLDPGIDHMSAMQLIHAIKNKGGTITSFKSHCGGLVAPESDDNPWHYKISWNPANVVNAGKQGAVYKKEGNVINLGYEEIFANCQSIPVNGHGTYAAYPNRDSLSYMPLYGLENIPTFIRTTLRHPDFCKGWQYIIKAGLTNTEPPNTLSSSVKKITSDWFVSCLNFYAKCKNFDEFLNSYAAKKEHPLIKKLFEYLGLFNTEHIPEKLTNSAAILQYLLEKKLVLRSSDKDMVIMMHEIDYRKQSASKSIKSFLVVKGEDNEITAMAKTVGLPLAIAAELILNKKIALKGLQIPIIEEIYKPVLEKLRKNGIHFNEN